MSALTPLARSFEHRSCKHLVNWGNGPEIIIVNAQGFIAIRRAATALEQSTVTPYEALCMEHRS